MRENVDLRNTNISASKGLNALLNEPRRAKGFERNCEYIYFLSKSQYHSYPYTL